VLKVLSGDVGGTTTRLALFDMTAGRAELLERRDYTSADYASFAEILADFSTHTDTGCGAACFGVAGPVRAGRSRITNLPWTIDAHELAAGFGWPRVGLLNDLEAIAWGIGALEEQDFCTLNAGHSDSGGNQAVIAAGTGLGQAGRIWDGQRHQPIACEGGHADFAPGSPTEAALLVWLESRFGHVSWERVVSGTGLVNIHAFLRDHRKAETPGWLQEQLQSSDAGAAISAAALEGTDAICREALDLFIRCYGAEAGNLALKLMATGGVFVAGGIAPRLIERLQQGDFIANFCAKGRMQGLMESMPVRVLLNERASLLGPAVCAAQTLATESTETTER
jgi:glucokinase